MDRILESAKKGHKRSKKEIYKRYANFYYGYIFKLTGSETLARDILKTTWQNIFLDIINIESINVALFRTFNDVWANNKTVLDSQGHTTNDHALLTDFTLNNKLLQLSDTELDLLLEQLMNSSSLEHILKLQPTLNKLLFLSDDSSEDIIKLANHLISLFQYHEIDKLMTYEIFAYIENRKNRTIVLYTGILLMATIIMILLWRELSVNKTDSFIDTQTPAEFVTNESLEDIEPIIGDVELQLIGSSLNGSIVESSFQLRNNEKLALDQIDMFIRFPRLTNISYKLKRVNDIYTLYYDLDYEKLLYDNILVEVSVITTGTLMLKEEFVIDLSLLEGWTKVYPINKKFDTGLTHVEIIDLTLSGPFLTLNIKELQSKIDSYHSYSVIVEDNNGNQYEGLQDYTFSDTFNMSFDNMIEYSKIETFDIYFGTLYYEELEYIGSIDGDKISFEYNNHDFLFEINRNMKGRVYFELTADDFLASDDFPNLLIRESKGWLGLYQNLFPYNTDITRLDYNKVYDRTDGHVTVEEMLAYYDETYNIILAEGDLSYQLQFLPEKEFVTVQVSDYRTDTLTYPSYFGDTLNTLELSHSSEFKEIEVNEHFRIECSEHE